jgi:hypothetical protein
VPGVTLPDKLLANVRLSLSESRDYPNEIRKSDAACLTGHPLALIDNCYSTIVAIGLQLPLAIVEL